MIKKTVYSGSLCRPVHHTSILWNNAVAKSFYLPNIKAIWKLVPALGHSFAPSVTSRLKSHNYQDMAIMAFYSFSYKTTVSQEYIGDNRTVLPVLQQHFGHDWEELVQMDISCVVFFNLVEQDKVCVTKIDRNIILQ